MRVRNWDAALIHWVEGLIGQPFIWGRTDCATLAREAAWIIRGEDPTPKMRAWRGPKSLVKIITEAGGAESLLATFAHPVGRRFVQTGDIVVHPDACPVTGLDSLYVVVNSHILVARPKELLRLERFVRLSDAVRVWRVD